VLFTGTTIWGGHIYVQGRALDIGDGVATTKVRGTYIDVGRGNGVFMSYGGRNLTMVGISLDLSPMAKKAGAKKLTVSKRYLLTQVWDVFLKTRYKYVPVSSTAASVPPTVLKKTSRTWPHEGG
jgi:hypothetical protein